MNLKETCLKFVANMLLYNLLHETKWCKYAVNSLPQDLIEELRIGLNKTQQMQIFGDYCLPFVRRYNKKEDATGFIVEIYSLNERYQKVLKERCEYDSQGQRDGSRILVFNNDSYMETTYSHGTQLKESLKKR